MTAVISVKLCFLCFSLLIEYTLYLSVDLYVSPSALDIIVMIIFPSRVWLQEFNGTKETSVDPYAEPIWAHPAHPTHTLIQGAGEIPPSSHARAQEVKRQVEMCPDVSTLTLISCMYCVSLTSLTSLIDKSGP